MLTGRPPFTGHLAQAIIFSHQEAEPPTLSSILGVGQIPPSLDAVMAKILRKQPAERYQTMGELRQDLVQIKDGVDLKAVAAISAASPKGKSNLSMIAVVLAVAIVSAGTWRPSGFQTDAADDKRFQRCSIRPEHATTGRVGGGSDPTGP